MARAEEPNLPLEDEQAQRVDPRLRMIHNGDETVNGRRAEQSAIVTVTSAHRARPETGGAALPDWEGPAKGVRVSAFLELDRAIEVRAPGLRIDRRDKIATAEFPVTQMDALARRPDVAYIAGGAILEPPSPVTEPGRPPQPSARPLSTRTPPQKPSVLLGFVDVGGFDFAHPDFLDSAGGTRFESIWDQGLTEDPAGQVAYGREITQEQMNKALKSTGTFGLPATELLRQSSQVAGSHATHVASIAGGNSGVLPTAALAGVSIALPEGDLDARRSFFDSVRLAHAVEYLFGLGEAEEIPVVVNISLGTNGHAHDGSSPISRWIDGALDQPGRCVVVAAGNAGQDQPRMEGDAGHLSGRIHTSGRVPASGLVSDIEWDVLGNGREDHSENEMEIWYESQDQFSVWVKPPSSQNWIGPVPPGGYIQNEKLDSETLISIYNERYLPANGANRISIFLSPRLLEPLAGVEAGRWIVRLDGQDIHDGRFDAWIERDDLRPVGRVGETTWGLPSLFSAASNVDNASINELACGVKVMAVANCDAIEETIHPTSSQGPTRDRRNKPDVAAPGTAISAANGFATPDRRWVAKTGTSMASPYVAGVAAWMLARQPRLTATQVIGMARRTAKPLPGHSYEWSDSAGFGRLDPDEVLDEVAGAFDEKDLGEDG